ncbi:MAG: 50S ribosomal protein L15 [Anaerolineae bacterium]|nr:50S ribosomal protein L15 [Anaerolineae bacterium]
MRLHDLGPREGSRKRRKRVGRGIAAGQGKTAGRGTKGQKSRSGGAKPPYFEGGQLPLVRRLPWRRGFTPLSRVSYTPVNLARLAEFEPQSVITPQDMARAGIIKEAEARVKVLGEGELDRPLTVWAHGFSASAREKIEAAGGRAELLES